MGPMPEWRQFLIQRRDNRDKSGLSVGSLIGAPHYLVLENHFTAKLIWIIFECLIRRRRLSP
jgi:hypothetical protein